MGFRQQLRPASYGVVPFWVDQDALGGGKRVQIHEYAERDDYFPEELGKKVRTFQVTAHLIGDDVFEQRDRLIDELELKGSKTLVLPSHAGIQAHCLDIKVLDSITGEGRISRLSLTFVKAGKNQFPAATVDTRQVVLDQSDTGIVALSKKFTDLFKMPSLQPMFVIDAAASLSSLIVKGIDAAIRRADADSDEKDDQLRNNLALDSDLSTRVKTPSTLASDLTGVYRAYVGLKAPARSTLDELRTLAVILDTAPAVPTGTVNRTREAQNQAALQALNRRTAVVEMARVATRITLVSSDDATALRDQIDVDLDAQIVLAGDAGEDDVFTELQELRAKTVQDLDARGARLPSLRTFLVPATLPALVIASRLYDDPSRDAEIVARNRIRSPGFVRAQSLLEVLAE